jgi:hypothetical protein
VAFIHSLYAGLGLVAMWWVMRAYSRYIIHIFARAMMLDVQIRN